MATESDEDLIELCRTMISPEIPSHVNMAAWERLRPWFSKKGYDLYHLDQDQYMWYPRNYVETEPDFFFAEMGEDWDPDQKFNSVRPLQVLYYHKVGFAQDASFRHFCLKIVESGSEEYKILRFLKDNKEEAMGNCVMPVLEFLEVGKYQFAVMPRWGNRPECPWFATVHQAAKFIQNILKAYSFLHKNFIVYQDIKLGNILVNHFAAEDGIECNDIRQNFKGSNRVRYVLCDFDSSFLLSPPSSGKPIRLPGEVSFDIYQPKPHDTSQGEPDYDPFAFDVGCLGIMFWYLFCTNVPNFPLLVPLVDKMITTKLEERFTAAEALQFVEKRILGSSIDSLDQPLEPLDRMKITAWSPDHYDKWVGLPAEFVVKWGSYRAPRSSRRVILLRKICTQIYKGYEVIKFFRTLHKHFKKFY